MLLLLLLLSLLRLLQHDFQHLLLLRCQLLEQHLLLAKSSLHAVQLRGFAEGAGTSRLLLAHQGAAAAAALARVREMLFLLLLSRPRLGFCSRICCRCCSCWLSWHLRGRRRHGLKPLQPWMNDQRWKRRK